MECSECSLDAQLMIGTSQGYRSGLHLKQKIALFVDFPCLSHSFNSRKVTHHPVLAQGEWCQNHIQLVQLAVWFSLQTEGILEIIKKQDLTGQKPSVT